MAISNDSIRDSFKLPAKYIILYLLVAAAISVAMPLVKSRPGEQVVYTKAALRLIEGEEFYRPEEGKAFTYPPFFALPFVPLAELSEPVRRGVWYFLNLTMMGAVIVLVAKLAWPAMHAAEGESAASRSAGFQPAISPADNESVIPGRAGWKPILLVAWLVIGVLSARFVISPVEYQGHDLIIFLLAVLAIAAWSKSADRWAGVWAGLGAACKATPLLFLPIFVLQRRFQAVLTFGAVAAAATLLPDLLFPRDDGGLWVTAWYEKFISKVEIGEAAEAKGAWISWNLLNQSLAGTLYRLSTPVEPFEAHVFNVSLWRLDGPALKNLITAAQLAVIGFLTWVTWPVRNCRFSPEASAFQKLGEGGAVLCGMLLLAPMSSKQHFCTLLVPITFCVVDYLYHRRDWMVAGLLAVVFLVGSVGTKDLLGRPWGNTLLAYGSLTLCAVACLLASGRILIRRRRLASASLPSERPIAQNESDVRPEECLAA